MMKESIFRVMQLTLEAGLEEAIILSIIVVLGVLVLLSAYVTWRRQRTTLPSETEERSKVTIFTFANHKGGTGKSTSLFFSMREIARLKPSSKILLLDFSLFGDITAMSMDAGKATSNDELIHKQATIEDVITGYFNPPAWYQTWKKRYSFMNHIASVQQPRCPNVHIMTSKHQHQIYDKTANAKIPQLSDNQISRLSSHFRSELENEGSEWYVFIDTDGGLMHEYSKLALCMANSIIVPLSCDKGAVRDTSRLNILFDYVANLRRQGYSDAAVDFAFFNNTRSNANKSCKELGSPFSPFPDVVENCKGIISQFCSPDREWQRDAEISKMLISFQKSVRECFTCIRSGGVEFTRSAPWKDDYGTQIKEDFGVLAQRLLDIAENKKIDIVSKKLVY